MSAIIHKAAEPIGAVQCCSECGEVLLDYSAADPGLEWHFYPTGTWLHLRADGWSRPLAGQRMVREIDNGARRCVTADDETREYVM